MTQKRSAGPTRRGVLAGAAAAGAVLHAPALVRAQAKSLKIAVLLPRSGYLAPAGQSCHRGALIAPKVLADYGHQVELVHVDVESNPDVARNQCERVINDGVNAVVGAFDSASTLAMAQVCEQRQVPLVVNIAAVPTLTDQGYKFLVRNFPTGGQLATNGLARIKDFLAATKAAPKTAVFLHANDTFGTAQRQAMDRLFPTSGLPFQLLESIAYDPRAQDLSVEVTKIRALKPDLLLVVTRAADAIKLVRDMVRQRFEPMGIISPGAPGLYDEEFYEALGPLADYHAYANPWANPKSQMAQALEAAFKPANPKYPLRGGMLQCRLHLRGPADRGRRIQARGDDRQRGLHEGDPGHRYRPACHDRPSHQIRRQRPEQRHPIRDDPEPQPHPYRGVAVRRRHHGAGVPDAALAGAKLTACG